MGFVMASVAQSNQVIGVVGTELGYWNDVVDVLLFGIRVAEHAPIAILLQDLLPKTLPLYRIRSVALRCS